MKMIELGKTRIIDNKVYFEYYLLEKPNPDHYHEGRNFVKKTNVTWDEALEEYEASKQLIEVENVKEKTEKVFVSAYSEAFIKLYYINGHQIQNNQECKAEANDKATITQLLVGGIPSWKIREKWVKIK